MQPIRQLMNTIGLLASPQACLFTPGDLRAILPEHSDTAFKTLLSRAVSEGHFSRVCRDLYLYDKAKPDRGRMLHHIAAKLRPLGLNYLSLETGGDCCHGYTLGQQDGFNPRPHAGTP